MKTINGNLLTAFENSEINCLFQVCNSYNIWGSGIVVDIKKLYPSAYNADQIAFINENNTLGNYSKALITDKIIYNLYAMHGIGNDGSVLNRNLDYDKLFDAMYTACEDVCNHYIDIQNTKIGIPYLMGCCRAGGIFPIVESMLIELEKLFDLEFIIYKLDNFEEKANSSVNINKLDKN